MSLLHEIPGASALLNLLRPRPSARVEPAPIPLPGRSDARSALGVAESATLVIGWGGPVDLRSGVLDLIEAVAICDDRVALLIPATGSFQHQVHDRADAMDLLHRVRFVPAAARPGPGGAMPSLVAFPGMLAAADVIITAAAPRRVARRAMRDGVALCGLYGIPVILSGLAGARAQTPMKRRAGERDDEWQRAVRWAVRAGDPGLMARLLIELAIRPEQAVAARNAIAAQVFSGSSAVVATARASKVSGRRTMSPWALPPGRAQGMP